MFKRYFLVAALAVIAAASSGCCGSACGGGGCGGGGGCSTRGCGSGGMWDGLFGNKWGCKQCGEFYWSEWFNDPPDCCEPCNCHGDYVGPHHGYSRAVVGQDFGPGPDAYYDDMASKPRRSAR